MSPKNLSFETRVSGNDQRLVGPAEPVFIIAEIGTSHGGDIETAKELIDAAIAAGADCVKFQAVFADEIIHPDTGNVDLPGGKIPLFKVFKDIERGKEFYHAIKLHAEEKETVFLCSPFGLRSAAMLAEIEVTTVKIASPEINHFPLLNFLANWGVNVIISSGVSTLADIERALAVLRQPKALLHCVTAYPAAAEEYNLHVLSTLSKLFGIPVGVSDHSLDAALVPALSVVCGGCIIEKHFTLSRNGTGLDDPVALPPDEFSNMVKNVRQTEKMEFDDALRKMKETYGKNRVEATLGSGRKDLAPSEKENYRTTNRSIMAIKNIKKGEALSEQNVALLRSEKNLLPGLSPDFWQTVIGKCVTKDVPTGKGIEWNDLLLDSDSMKSAC
jgi:sialic acid synthase SpsE